MQNILIMIRFECQPNILCILLVVCLIVSCITLFNTIYEAHTNRLGNKFSPISLDLNKIDEVLLSGTEDQSQPRNLNCSIWNCINLYRCGHEQLAVYVYPIKYYIDKRNGEDIAPLTNEFYQILDAIIKTPYYTPNPNKACLFVPSIDVLNQNRIKTEFVNRALASLEYWNDGENHMLFNMLSGVHPAYNRVIDIHSDKSIIIGAGFDTWSYRMGFDVSIPVWSPLLIKNAIAKSSTQSYLLIVAQLNLLPRKMWLLRSLAEEYPKDVLLLKEYNITHRYSRWGEQNEENELKFAYPDVLSEGTFCLLGPSLRLGQPDLLEMLAHNCIPVIAINNHILPFEELIDWSLVSIRILETDLVKIVEILRNVSPENIQDMQRQGRALYNTYFNSLDKLTLTTLNYLQCRIFPYQECNKKNWNFLQNTIGLTINPLFLTRVAGRSEGFTALILTYDRVDSLFLLIEKLSLVPSLHSILIVWNNQQKSPPHLSTFPVISRSIKIIQTRKNLLSNRFFPYKEIETEAILSIDDDINMLTADEVDFGFEVWREFPDRIVGFPSRLHKWKNVTASWCYESEWTNQISMVLTGAAFYHKYWNHMYTYRMPTIVKRLVDGRMNCEDIAMNFLVANVTNKPPIKVTPRKKFKCPECTSNEMLSADLNHMRERSRCIHEFAQIYGRMPLRSVEFRADPVLFKDNFPEKLKRFSDMGTL